MNTPRTPDDLWKAYQIGRISVDHTDKQVFAEVIKPVLRDLAAAQDKALRFDLDEAGIAQREEMAVEVVTLRADLAARDAELARVKDKLRLAFNEDLKLKQLIADVAEIRALKERAERAEAERNVAVALLVKARRQVWWPSTNPLTLEIDAAIGRKP